MYKRFQGGETGLALEYAQRHRTSILYVCVYDLGGDGGGGGGGGAQTSVTTVHIVIASLCFTLEVLGECVSGIWRPTPPSHTLIFCAA